MCPNVPNSFKQNAGIDFGMEHIFHPNVPLSHCGMKTRICAPLLRQRGALNVPLCPNVPKTGNQKMKENDAFVPSNPHAHIPKSATRNISPKR